jgi:hypothetical protein
MLLLKKKAAEAKPAEGKPAAEGGSAASEPGKVSIFEQEVRASGRSTIRPKMQSHEIRLQKGERPPALL